MKALSVMAESLRAGYVHPTTVLNTLIELENAGGLSALRQFAEQVSSGQEALEQRGHPHARLAAAWVQATHFYLSEHPGQQGAA